MALESGSRPEALPIRCVLPNGAAVLIRAVRPGDAARLDLLFYRLSSESIYSYFFLPLPRQPHWAARLSEIARADGVNHGALVALADEEIVGVTRYDRIASEEAEFALLIEDAWQQRGLGKRLLEQLIKEAHRHGVVTFRASILGENRRALRLVAALFTTVQTQYYGHECLIEAPTAALRWEGLCDG